MQHTGRDKSFVYDLTIEPGTVRVRVASVPRSTEVQPGFVRFDTFHSTLPTNTPPANHILYCYTIAITNTSTLLLSVLFHTILLCSIPPWLLYYLVCSDWSIVTGQFSLVQFELSSFDLSIDLSTLAPVYWPDLSTHPLVYYCLGYLLTCPLWLVYSLVYSTALWYHSLLCQRTCR